MARRFPKRRKLVISAIIVALAIGIVFVSIPYLPHPPPRTIQTPVTKDIRGGSQRYPGVYALTLQNVSSTDNFAIGASVANGNATFCVEPQTNFINWTFNNQTSNPPGIPFSFVSCILNMQTSQTVLRFTPTSAGSWDVVAVNINSQMITVNYTPAS
jgi:hypothetical protein